MRADLERLEIEGDSARAGLALAEDGERTSAENLLASRARGADSRRVAALLVRRGFSEETVEALVVAGSRRRVLLARARARAVGYGSYFRIICRQTAALAANFREHRAAFVVSAALGDRPVPRGGYLYSRTFPCGAALMCGSRVAPCGAQEAHDGGGDRRSGRARARRCRWLPDRPRRVCAPGDSGHSRGQATPRGRAP